MVIAEKHQDENRGGGYRDCWPKDLSSSNVGQLLCSWGLNPERVKTTQKTTKISAQVQLSPVELLDCTHDDPLRGEKTRLRFVTN